MEFRFEIQDDELKIIEPSAIEGDKFDEWMDALALALNNAGHSSIEINSEHFTEDHALKLIDWLEKKPDFAIEIILPERLQNTRSQVLISHIVSDHQYAHRIANLGDDPKPLKLAPAKAAVPIVVPKKLAPKIAIIASDAKSNFIESAVVDPAFEPQKPVKPPRSFQRKPLPASVVTQILEIKAPEQLIQWQQCSDLEESRRFQTELCFELASQGNQPHLLFDLVNAASKEKLVFWTEKLNLSAQQHSALLDVYGQYGDKGLSTLFGLWDAYDENQLKVFQQTHESLLKDMPTYLPFIEDPDFDALIKTLASWGDAKISWWSALIKNHHDAKADDKNTDLVSLFQEFSNFIVTVEKKLKLSFGKESIIDGFKDVQSLSKNLSDVIALLSKLDPDHGDRGIQWNCIHEVLVSKHAEFAFILPEMNISLEDTPEPDFTKIVNCFKQNSPKLDRLLLENQIPDFFRYLSAAKKRLPIKYYREALQKHAQNITYPANEAELRLYDMGPFNTQVQLGLLYMMALTTSSQQDLVFDIEAIKQEWEDCLDRLRHLTYLGRIKKNKDKQNLGGLFYYGILGEGGVDAVRHKVLEPLVLHMPNSPPLLNYLHKIIKAAQYRFLDPQLNLLAMKAKQIDLNDKMAAATELYSANPTIMQSAVRFLNNELVELDRASQTYKPEDRDIYLLERFNGVAQAFVKAEHNNLYQDYNPERVLLPLLTIFRLEYAVQIRDNLCQTLPITKIINLYKEKLDQLGDDSKKELFVYGLSLMQEVVHRGGGNTQLTHTHLETIIKDLADRVAGEDRSKKNIRAWFKENYGGYFAENSILDEKERVELGAHFEALGVDDPTLRDGISKIVANFDDPDELKDQTALASTLVQFCQKINAEQRKLFFDFCDQAFTNKGLFHRDQQDTPPSYIEQFKKLIDEVNRQGLFAEYERFMRLLRESGVPYHGSFQGCAFFLNQLYPSFCHQGILPKDAFKFAAELVFHSPISAFKANQKISDAKRQKSELDAIILGFKKKSPQFFGLFQVDTPRTYEDIKKLRDQIKALIYSGTLVHHLDIYKFLGFLQHILHEQNNQPDQTKIPHLDKFYQRLNTASWDVKFIKNYEESALYLYTKKTEVQEKYRNIATAVDLFLTQALSIDAEDFSQKQKDLEILMENLLMLDSQNLVFSLVSNYQKDGKYGGIEDLVQIFTDDAWVSLRPELKRSVMKALISQMNNGAEFSKNEIQEFLRFIHVSQSEPEVISHLENYYQQAPYPPLSLFINWHRPDVFIPNQISYEEFDLNPWGVDGREPENKFEINQAQKTLAQMSPATQKLFDDGGYMFLINEYALESRALPTAELIDKLAALKHQNPMDEIKMVLFAAELMYRAKAEKPLWHEGKRINGRSWELNSTQIIALIALLKTGDKAAAEIATGEGKSRIVMILNAVQCLKGKTVDFITSDLSLAGRDYLESLPFLESLGIQTTFINDLSEIEDYQKGGIHVTDFKKLASLRTKAAAHDRLDEVLDQEANRAMVIDEADLAFLNQLRQLYSYSTNHVSEKNLKLVPVYPLLMNFFAEGNNASDYLVDKNKAIDAFINQLEQSNPLIFQFFMELGRSKQEKLFYAAYQARRLREEYNQFIIDPNASSSGLLGEEKVAAAYYCQQSEVDKSKVFLEDVHQCLHAELNRLLSSASDEEQKPKLKQALDECKKLGRRFIVEPVKDIAYTFSQFDIFRMYEKGSIHAVTGTIGSISEQKEVKENLDIDFLKLPRHKGLNRLDRDILVAPNESNQFQAIKEHIILSRAKAQPVLIICESDEEADVLFKKMQKILGGDQLHLLPPSLSAQDAEAERFYIKTRAGLPGQVTISTEKSGRGTDIKLKEASHHFGLKVLMTYLPYGQRNHGQIIGRAGRYGDEGESQMVLNLERVLKEMDFKKLNNFFKGNPAAFVEQIQDFHTKMAELDRSVGRDFDRYLLQLKAMIPKNHDHKESLVQLAQRFREVQSETETLINKELDQPIPDLSKIKTIFLKQHETLLGILKDEFGIEDPNIKPMKVPNLLTIWLESLTELSQSPPSQIKLKRTVPIREHYDPETHGGHVHLEHASKPFYVTNWANFKAYWQGTGVLFPNWDAYWRGEISLKNFLMNRLQSVLALFIKFPVDIQAEEKEFTVNVHESKTDAENPFSSDYKILQFLDILNHKPIEKIDEEFDLEPAEDDKSTASMSDDYPDSDDEGLDNQDLDPGRGRGLSS